MPGMDGLEALPLIRRAAPDTSVIVFSGFTEARMASLVLERGADRYIEKGEPLERVREAVRELADYPIACTARHDQLTRNSQPTFPLGGNSSS